MHNHRGHRFYLSVAIFLSIACFILASSCRKPSPDTGAPEGNPEANRGNGIVIINTAKPPAFSGDMSGIKRIILDTSEERISVQLARAMKAAVEDSATSAIVVFPAIEGTAAQFAIARESRPDILLYAIEPRDDLLEIEEAADFSISGDQAANAYGAVWAAARLGCTSITYVSSRLPPEEGRAEVRRTVIREAAAEFGMPMHEGFLVPRTGARLVNAFSPGKVPLFTDAAELVLSIQSGEVKEKGTRAKVAWYLADDEVISPMLPAVLTIGGIVTGMNSVSFFPHYPAFAGISGDSPDSRGLLAEIEKALTQKGGAGRFIIQGYPDDSAIEASVLLCLRALVAGDARKPDAAMFLRYLAKATPGIAWRADYSVDRLTGVRSRNHLLIFQDMYLIGRGYLPFTKDSIPEKYRR